MKRVLLIGILLLAGCQMAPAELGQQADEIGPQRVQSIAGNLMYVESLQMVFPNGVPADMPMWKLLDHVATTMTYTHSDGAVTTDGVQQGSSDQSAEQTSTPTQTTQVEATVDPTPG